MIDARAWLRRDDPDDPAITIFSLLARWLSMLPRRIVLGVRCRGEAAFHCYCFKLATARHEVGAYGSLSSIPEGVPAGVMVVLAVVIILRTTFAARLRPCDSDA